LSPLIFKNCARSLTASLTFLYNLSLFNGVIPSDWKKANVVPIFKKGDKHNIKNYRPVSLLSIAGKVLEKCVHHYVSNITANDISPKQHGFKPRKSTSSQLVEFYDKVYNNLDNKRQTDVVYLDLSKAFDSVPHNLLLVKLKTFGFNGRLLNWFRNYLSNRFQRVVLNGDNSKYKPVKSGVPQGSILGPLLFTYFINDINKELSSNSIMYLYADDSKLGYTINNRCDCIILQNDINLLTAWSTKWGLSFNASKCCVMSFLKGHNKIIHDYTMNGLTLSRVNSIDDLGIIVRDDLRWEDNTLNIVNRANKRLGLVKRCVGYNCNSQVKLLCYISLVRPILEYASVAWFCDTKKSLLKIESVQRRALKFVLNDYTSSYKFRLEVCDILPLSLRRDYLDLIFFYNNLHNLNEVELNVNFHVHGRGRTRLANDDLLLYRNIKRYKFMEKWYCHRIVNIWNRLPYEVRNTELTANGKNTTFKKTLKVWLKEFCNENFTNNVCSWSVYCGCSVCDVT
jgi:hypothetical protein